VTPLGAKPTWFMSGGATETKALTRLILCRTGIMVGIQNSIIKCMGDAKRQVVEASRRQPGRRWFIKIHNVFN